MKPALVLSALALALSVQAQNQPASPAAKPSLTIQTTQAQPAQWASRLPVNGNVAAWQEAVIGAEVGGMRIAELLVNVGDRVKKGQLLVRLSPGTLQADLAATRASLQEAEVNARDARAQAERVKPLTGTEALSAQQIEATLAAADMAEARVASLKARLMADELRLGYTRITAPDDGVITAREAVEGALAQPGQELLRLQRQGRLEWRAEVPARCWTSSRSARRRACKWAAPAWKAACARWRPRSTRKPATAWCTWTCPPPRACAPACSPAASCCKARAAC